MTYNKGVLERQISVVGVFVQELAYFRGLKAGLASLADYRAFWSCTLNSHLKQATVDWCKVFGKYDEDIHWTKLPVGSTAQQAQQDFRRRVLSGTGFSQQEWEDYHRTMLDMRNKYVAHRDLQKPITEDVPLFDAALQVADVYREWVRQVIKPTIMSSYPFSADYEMWKTEASTIVSRYPHP